MSFSIIHVLGVGLMLFSAGTPAGAASRPVVALVAQNGGTETTDFLVPFGVLVASDAVELHPVALEPGPVALHPALRVELDETTTSFDARHPHGADVVIVPAVHDPTDARLIAWLGTQAARGATLVAICDGVWAVAATGVLDGRRATGHWYSLDGLAAQYPKTEWVRDRRYVRDGPVMTTTGVTASLPASLALVEAIAGVAAARRVADAVGVAGWDAEHDGTRFALSTRDAATAAGNWLAFWWWETIGIPIEPGTDEIALALAADAWSRTYRSTVLTIAASTGSDAIVRSKRGMRLRPDRRTASDADRVERIPDTPAALALDEALRSIARVHGDATADFVALQVEYPTRRFAARAPAD